MEFDISKIKAEIMADLQGLGLGESKPQRPVKEPQESEIFGRLTMALAGVGTPEIEFVLGSENIIEVENRMKQKFDGYVFTKFKDEFAKQFPEICEEYVNTAIKNKEEYGRINAKKLKEQAAELEKERKANADLLKRIEDLERQMKSRKGNNGGGEQS